MNEISPQIMTMIRSEMLAHLRAIDGFKKIIGPVAQFTIVVDANIILSDLIWLVSKRRNPEAQTELMECIRAETVIAYITRTVYEEVNEHISSIAVKQGISKDALRKEWKSYRKLIKIRTPRKALVDRHKGGRDPDDAPTIALEKMIHADGILSKDTDIVAMGGLVIELDFTKQARDYSRKTAVAATIRLGAGLSFMAAWTVVELALKAIQAIIEWFRSLPDWIQAIHCAAFLVVMLDDRVLTRISAMLASLQEDFLGGKKEIVEPFLSLCQTYIENVVQPPIPTFK